MNQPQNAMAFDDESEPEIKVTSAIPRLEKPIDDNVVGERFGKYLIVGELAVGGMAEVFLGVQRGIEGFTKVVVIKRVLPQYNENPDFVRMFVDEARLAARLEHPNIVRTYEFGELDGQYFTTMEYLPGEDLSKVLNKLSFSQQRMPLHIAGGIVSQLCSGLHFAHQLTDTAGRPLNLVHRDVNPANVIVTYTGEVKIIDFGVAKTTSSQTVNGTIKGKLAYMAPEQLLARGVDQRSDVFSTGVVLWELLVGKPLFIRDSEAATLYAIMNDPIRPPSRFRYDVPRELDDIVMRALARTPADRYDTAEEMGDALEQFLETQPKYDGRSLARLVEELFGPTRAEAKRSISRSSSLGRNISLVMKLRTDVRADLAERLDSLAAGSSHVHAAGLLGGDEPEPRSRLTLVWAGLILACMLGGLLYVLFGSGVTGSEREAVAKPMAQTSLRVESTPPGAAIYLGGEPTGLKTPATLTGMTGKQVSIRLKLADHGTITETIDVSAGGTVTKHVKLGPVNGRLVLAQLPKGSTVYVDGTGYDAGEAIEVGPGKHEVRVVSAGTTIVEQTVETVAGDKVWRLVADKLVPNN